MLIKGSGDIEVLLIKGSGDIKVLLIKGSGDINLLVIEGSGDVKGDIKVSDFFASALLPPRVRSLVGGEGAADAGGERKATLLPPMKEGRLRRMRLQSLWLRLLEDVDFENFKVVSVEGGDPRGETLPCFSISLNVSFKMVRKVGLVDAEGAAFLGGIGRIIDFCESERTFNPLCEFLFRVEKEF